VKTSPGKTLGDILRSRKEFPQYAVSQGILILLLSTSGNAFKDEEQNLTLCEIQKSMVKPHLRLTQI